MFKESRFKMAIFGGVLLAVSCSVSADGADNQKSYGAQVADKAGHALANITTAWIEVPKNIYIMTRETNIIYGFIGGTGMGIFNLAGRVGTGVFDLVTLPIPTDQLIHPGYVWDDFGTKTTYGVQFYLEEPVTQTAPQ
ncbi:MAG: exosortase system-associated protein, TIGR04073 family [Methylobacter sp.]|jgi:putative exosortase-associated protein (TIGR04073 family)|nr:exosortase system-associated protein, TIGR04073 family [Methylobacter sp.]